MRRQAVPPIQLAVLVVIVLGGDPVLGEVVDCPILFVVRHHGDAVEVHEDLGSLLPIEALGVAEAVLDGLLCPGVGDDVDIAQHGALVSRTSAQCLQHLLGIWNCCVPSEHLALLLAANVQAHHVI